MQIVVVSMVKDESRFIGPALRSVVGFADRVIVIDTGSTDNTVEIADAELDAAMQDYEIHHEPILTRTHRFVVPYVGTDTWVFGVDGDEIFDPERLREMRTLIKAGIFENAYQIKGPYLHAVVISGNEATGYMGPPSWNPTKLYNFANILEWPEDGERTLFHCKTRQIKQDATKIDTGTWDASPLRCLHTRHMQGDRLNPEDLIGHGSASDRGGERGKNKRRSYRVGPVETVDISNWEEVLHGASVE